MDNGVQEAIEIDGNIYFFLDPKTEFFNPNLTHLDQPIEVIEEYFFHMKVSVLNQTNEWTLSELFDYCKEQELIDEDENINSFFESRADLLESVTEHREENFINKLSNEELLERYKNLFA